MLLYACLCGRWDWECKSIIGHSSCRISSALNPAYRLSRWRAKIASLYIDKWEIRFFADYATRQGQGFHEHIVISWWVLGSSRLTCRTHIPLCRLWRLAGWASLSAFNFASRCSSSLQAKAIPSGSHIYVERQSALVLFLASCSSVHHLLHHRSFSIGFLGICLSTPIDYVAKVSVKFLINQM